MTEGKWIYFDEVCGMRAKTKIYNVHSKQDHSIIGQVKWYGPWRQYGFYPSNATVYERQCLLDITKFLHHLMLERKMKKQIQN